MEIRFPCLGTFFSGTVKDLSEKNLFINSIICFPVGSTLEMIILSKKKVLTVPVKVKRVMNTDGIDKGMGVEVLNLPKEYLEIVIGLDLGCQP